MKPLDRRFLAVLLHRAGLPPTKKRVDDLIGPARYIEAAGRRLTRADTAMLSPVGRLWTRRRG